MTALSAENNYVGVSCGKLDQSCEVYSKKDHLLYLDTKDDSYELILAHPDMKPYKIAIFFSGEERTLAGSKYNMRVDECKSVAYALKAYAGMEYGKFNETVLRDVPYEVYLQYKERLYKSGVVTIGENDEILRMVEKPAEPESHWCCPPFYFYTREDAKLKKNIVGL